MWRRDEELIIITVYLPILFLQDMAQAIVDEIQGLSVTSRGST
jgi:hypothetical protein